MHCSGSILTLRVQASGISRVIHFLCLEAKTPLEGASNEGTTQRDVTERKRLSNPSPKPSSRRLSVRYVDGALKGILSFSISDKGGSKLRVMIAPTATCGNPA